MLLTWCASALLIPVLLAAQTTVHPGIDSAMTCLVEQRYDEARELLDDVLKEEPGNTDALYMQITVEQTRLLDYESYTLEGDEFLVLADSVSRLIEAASRRPMALEDSVRYLFYLGNIHGGSGLILAKNGNWFRAVKSALKSVSLLEEVKELEPSFYAAYLGIGVFNYYLSQNLTWVPFLGDKTEEGLAAIRKSTKARFPYNYGAKNSLCWILIDRNQYAEADSIVESVLKDYPENTIFLRIKARIESWTHHHENAAKIGARLAQIAEKRTPTNWSDLLMGYHVEAESRMKIGQQERARQIARKALSLRIPAKSKAIPYVRDHLASLREIANDGGTP